MHIPKPFFHNVSTYGDLSVEQVLEQYQILLFFVLKDDFHNRYICTCFNVNGSQDWILAPIDTLTLIKLIENKIDIQSSFEPYKDHLIHIQMDYDTHKDSHYKINWNTAKRYIPKANEYLDPEPEEIQPYLDKLIEES